MKNNEWRAVLQSMDNASLGSSGAISFTVPNLLNELTMTPLAPPRRPFSTD